MMWYGTHVSPTFGRQAFSYRMGLRRVLNILSSNSGKRRLQVSANSQQPTDQATSRQS